ncbi:hypothetical protein [Dysgonomonas sp. 520]|uniref:hypothetical protein n=1 Tax=Dysgonomonas sp. 520 TaxID=2302931 RepID=UPI0013D808C0|nr:hypothetical protein [Dysgonomonas sp. 520]NDW11012.1 hypothetical protein [Dysgonomonas sp. 520]
MRKIKWINLIVFVCCILVMLAYTNYDIYDEFVQHPLDNGSGTTGSRLFYFIQYSIDKYIGKVGVFIFFTILALYFLYDFLNENISSIKNRCRDWKEKRERNKKK